MRPQLDSYKILKMDKEYHVLTPYDLFTMPNLKITGQSYPTRKEALKHLAIVYNSDLEMYEYLQRQGRSFPDND